MFMKSRIIPYSLIIASTIILCTSFQCSKEERIPVTSYHSYINNSSNTVELYFENFEACTFFDEHIGYWDAPVYHSVDYYDVLLYPMEKVTTRYELTLSEEEAVLDDKQQLLFDFFKHRLRLNRSNLYLYEYDLETQSRGKLIKKWVPSDNANRWSYYQIDSSNFQWTINLFE